MKMKRFFVAAAVALAGLVAFSACTKDEDTTVPKVSYYSDAALHNEATELTNPVWVVVSVDAETKLDKSATTIMAVNGDGKVDLSKKVDWEKGNVDHEYKAKVDFPSELYKEGAVLEVTATDKNNGIKTSKLAFKKGGTVVNTEKTFTKAGDGALHNGNVNGKGAWSFADNKAKNITSNGWDIAVDRDGVAFGLQMPKKFGTETAEYSVKVNGQWTNKTSKGNGYKCVKLTKDKAGVEKMTLKDAEAAWKDQKTGGDMGKGDCYLLSKDGKSFVIIIFGKAVKDNVPFEYFRMAK